MDLEAQSARGSVPEPDAFVGAGAQLKAAREAAGLSLDQVAQQLKLAPRQVRALEDEDFGMLPGRTFTRGFMRNYARLLNLDPDLLVAHLPDASHAPSLESPPLHSTGTTMAELPTAHARAPSFGRWLIPLVLVAAIVVGVAGVLTNADSAHTLTDNFSIFGFDAGGSTGTLFLYGIVVGAIGVIGLGLLLAGARRSARRGHDARRGLKESRRETAAAIQQRDDLVDQRDTARGGGSSGPPTGS